MGQPTFDFGEQVVVVTGGSRGVGAGIVAAFVAAGARVVTCGRTPTEVDGAVFVTADVRQADQARQVIDTAVVRFGRLDILVNSAGGPSRTEADVADPGSIESIVGANLLAPFFCAQAAHDVMVQQEEGGTIVNVGRLAGAPPSVRPPAYGAARAGLVNLTATLAVEWAPQVRVNAVSAGLMVDENGDEAYGGLAGAAAAAATVPLGRLGTAADVAQACLFLASPAASYISGANLLVHGGGKRPVPLADSSATEGA